MMAENDPTLERLFKGHRGMITGLSFNPDSTKLVSSGTDAKIMLWNFNKNARALSIENHLDSVTGVHFAASGNMFASCSKDKSVRVWKPSVKLSCKHFRAHTSAVRSIHMSPSSDTLLTASNDKSIKLWTTEYHNQFLSTFLGHTHWVNCARFAPNGTLITSCSEDKTVKLWDQHSKYCVQTFYEKDGVPKHVEFHPNSKCIGVCLSKNIVKIYDTRSYKLLQLYNVHSDSVNQIAFHPNGNFMISVSSDKTAKVFDLVEGRVLYTLAGHDGPVTSVAFSSNGNFFATGGADKKILVWKSNFDKEVLAKPLVDETSDYVQTKSLNKEENARKIDGKKSFSKMEQPDIEDSNVQTSTSNSSDDEKPVIDEEPKTAGSSLELTLDDGSINCGSDELNDTNDIKNILSTLKLQVMDIQKQVLGISDRLTSLEEICDKNSTDKL